MIGFLLTFAALFAVILVSIPMPGLDDDGIAHRGDSDQ